MRHLLILLLSLCAAAAHADVTHIDNEELARLMAAGVPIVDLRTEGEWKETGIVHGSRLMTFFDEKGRADAPAWVEKLKAVAKPDEPVVLICRTGNRTGVVARFLDEKVGYRKVYNVKHGIYGWMKDKRPVEPALAGCAAGRHC